LPGSLNYYKQQIIYFFLLVGFWDLFFPGLRDAFIELNFTTLFEGGVGLEEGFLSLIVSDLRLELKM
jgi:hypothetical protein